MLLPRSEINRASGQPYNITSQIFERPGEITAWTDEMIAPMGMVTDLLWELSGDFQPERVAYDSNYRNIHRHLEKQGLIHHKVEDCPEQRTPALATVFDENGVRRSVPVPWVQ